MYYSLDNEFYKNDELLKSLDEERDFDINDLKKLIQQELNAILYTKFDNIILLAGAGASVVEENGSISDKFGKTVSMIANDIFEQLKVEKGVYTLSELDEISNFSNIKNLSITKTVGEGDSSKEVLSDSFNLEDFLSNLQNYEPYVTKNKAKKYRKSLDTILEMIKRNTDYDYDKGKLKHGALINILTKKIKAPNKLSIVTTNYDTLFEEAGASLNYTIFDGFNFDSQAKFESDLFDWNLVREVPMMKTNELEYREKVFNLIKIHGSLTWEKGTDGKIYRKSKDMIKNATDTVMIFPSSDKYAQSYQEPYFELFTKFQEFLKKQNTLLITTGFSFADNHISKMITQAIKSNPSLSVIVSDVNIDQQGDNWKELVHLMESHSPVIFLKGTLNGELTDYLGGKYAN